MAGDNKWQEHVVDDEGSTKKGKGGKAMATAIKVKDKKEDKGNKEGDGVGDEGGRQQQGQ